MCHSARDGGQLLMEKSILTQREKTLSKLFLQLERWTVVTTLDMLLFILFEGFIL